ncbi:Protein LATERAL ORGAN BOUNDARIES [Senna tora]|uniref:Protein LATERAL ORGAN BOUNDARIES n=1 Tax=Senna tora TaxID=362788 RepID=A0A834W4Z8_9FABA|nr:Protein LATERAL ORGAN BOUNDARIES [Senna tora]
MPGCIFAPYFPPEEPQKFANVHKIFGASNVTKLLNELLPHQREDAVNSLAYEAEARVRDPVYGCVGAISFLQRQVQKLQKELDAANADLLRFACTTTSDVIPPPNSTTTNINSLIHHHLIQRPRSASSSSLSISSNSSTMDYVLNARIHPNNNNNSSNSEAAGGGGGGGGFYRQYPTPYNYSLPYTIPWADTTTSDGNYEGAGTAGAGAGAGAGGCGGCLVVE